MPLPVAHSLVGASIVTLAMRRFDPRLDWKPLLVGAFLGVLPDIDLMLTWGLGRGLEYHGTYTHSILFAVAAGAATCLLRGELQPRAVAGYVGAVLSHGLLDILTKDQFGGAALFWPFSTSHLRLGLLPNYEFYPNPRVQSWWRIVTSAGPFFLNELKLYLPLLLLAVIYRTRHGATAMAGDSANPSVVKGERHRGKNPQ
jgi:membrane-bound metal-dependent hydrolase YbcI (DUF457 family)